MSSIAYHLHEDPLPDRMPHRDVEIGQLSRALGPVDGGLAPHNARILGPAGAGKTTIAQFVLQKYTREEGDVCWRHIDCITHSSAAAILYQCTRGLPNVPPGTFTQGSDSKSQFAQALADCDVPFVAILDEASEVDNPNVFAMLSNIEGVGVWVIGHNEASILSDVRQDVGESISSRVRDGPRVPMDKYSVDEVVDILEARVPTAVANGRVNRAALEEIGDRVAGNARKALTLLRHALTDTERSGEKVTPGVVDRVADNAWRSLREDNLERLDTEHRIIHELLLSAGELSGREIHDRIEARMGTEYSYGDRNGFISKLREYDAVEKRGQTSDATYVALPVG